MLKSAVFYEDKASISVMSMMVKSINKRATIA